MQCTTASMGCGQQNQTQVLADTSVSLYNMQIPMVTTMIMMYKTITHDNRMIEWKQFQQPSQNCMA